MLITITTSEGALAIINPALITHIVPSNPAYLEDGSVIHFFYEHAIHVPEQVGELAELLEVRGAERTTADKSAFPLPNLS